MNPSISGLIGRIVEHARHGTLLARLSQALQRSNGAADPDHYHGDTATNYLVKRLQQTAWHVEQEIVRDLLHGCADGSTVLDVPFGTGRFVDMYLARGMSVSGIDISQDMLDVARQELGDAYQRCDVRLGDATALPYPDASFDLVVCFRFFGLISFEMARDVLAEIYRVSRDKTIIRVPVRTEPVARNTQPQARESVQGQLLESELVALFKEHGFEVCDSRLIEQRNKVNYNVYVLSRLAGGPLRGPDPR